MLQWKDTYGAILYAHECFRSYSIHRVVRTNLMLLAVDAQCYCIMDPPISTKPIKVEYILFTQDLFSAA